MSDGRRRIAQVIDLDPASIDAYERLHAETWPGVLDAIRRANVRNYSIFRHGAHLFSYFEYVGHDFEADMATIAADPVTQEWWELTGPMQRPLPERRPGEWWMTIPEVFHAD